MNIEIDVSQELIDELVSAGVLELNEVDDSEKIALMEKSNKQKEIVDD